MGLTLPDGIDYSRQREAVNTATIPGVLKKENIWSARSDYHVHRMKVHWKEAAPVQKRDLSSQKSILTHFTIIRREPSCQWSLDREVEDKMRFWDLTRGEAESAVFIMDNQLLFSMVNMENLAISGTLATREGREVLFRDGDTFNNGKLASNKKNISLFSNKPSNLTSVIMATMRNTNSLNTLRLAADSPMVIVTPNLMAEIERAAKPNPSRPWVGKPSLEHMLPPDTDGIPTSFVSIACSNADRKIKGLCTYEDQMHMEFFLMDEDDDVEEVASQLSRTDSEKLLGSSYKKEDKTEQEEDPKLLQFHSTGVWNIKCWREKNTKEFKLYEYPENSATLNYIKLMDIHFTAKYENLRSGRKGKVFDAPWSRHLINFFEWKPEPMNHDLLRLLTIYPMIDKFAMLPTPEQVYDKENKMKEKEKERTLSELKDFKKEEDPMWSGEVRIIKEN